MIAQKADLEKDREKMRELVQTFEARKAQYEKEMAGVMQGDLGLPDDESLVESDEADRGKKNLLEERRRFEDEKAQWDRERQDALDEIQRRKADLAEREQRLALSADDHGAEGPSADAVRVLTDQDLVDDLEAKKDVIRRLVQEKVEDLRADKESLAREREMFEKERQAWAVQKQNEKVPELIRASGSAVPQRGAAASTEYPDDF